MKARAGNNHPPITHKQAPVPVREVAEIGIHSCTQMRFDVDGRCIRFAEKKASQSKGRLTVSKTESNCTTPLGPAIGEVVHSINARKRK